MKIAVIGGGIIGSTCAYQALQTNLPITELHVYADKTNNDTTSSGAAGLWRPAAVAKTPREKLDRWAKSSLKNGINILAYDPDAAAKGFAPAHGYLVSRKPIPDEVWSHYGISFVKMTEAQMRQRFPNLHEEIRYAVSFSSFTLEASRFLPYLKNEIEKLGGLFINRKIKSLKELTPKYDIIFNCSGLGARDLVSDKEVFPIRGQILCVKAPWQKEFVYNIDIIDGNVPYIIPNIDYVILGGTKQENNSSLNPTQKDRDWILEHTKKLVPSMEKVEVIKEWVGLRPGRSKIRLEIEEFSGPISDQPSRKVPVIHNYGHGANGISLSWGCAENAIELLEDWHKNTNMIRTIKSKL